MSFLWGEAAAVEQISPRGAVTYKSTGANQSRLPKKERKWEFMKKLGANYISQYVLEFIKEFGTDNINLNQVFFVFHIF